MTWRVEKSNLGTLLTNDTNLHAHCAESLRHTGCRYARISVWINNFFQNKSQGQKPCSIDTMNVRSMASVLMGPDFPNGRLHISLPKKRREPGEESALPPSKTPKNQSTNPLPPNHHSSRTSHFAPHYSIRSHHSNPNTHRNWNDCQFSHEISFPHKKTKQNRNIRPFSI